MEQTTKLNQAQYEILNTLSCLDKEEDVIALKDIIVQFLNTRLQNEINRLWENGTITQEKMDEWGKEHMRTPYNRMP